MKKNTVFLFILLSLVLLLSACAPKYQYVSEQMPEPRFGRIYVVMDFVEFVDDVGKLYDYDLSLNQEKLQNLQSKLTQVLSNKGFEDVYFISKSSGINLNPGLNFELYHNKKFQEKLVSPPFLIEAQNISIEEQDALLSVMTQFQSHGLVPVKDENMNYLDRLQMEPVYLSDDLFSNDGRATDQSAAILFIQVTRPRVSFAKGFGVSLMSVALTAGASGGSFYASVTPHGVPYSNGLLFDMESGQLLWKNFQQSSVESMQSQSLNNFFKHFPVSEK